jgi:hypothetical protein
MTPDLSPGLEGTGSAASHPMLPSYAARAAEAVAEVARAAESSRRAAAEAQRARTLLRRQQDYAAAAKQRISAKQEAHAARVAIHRRDE